MCSYTIVATLCACTAHLCCGRNDNLVKVYGRRARPGGCGQQRMWRGFAEERGAVQSLALNVLKTNRASSTLAPWLPRVRRLTPWSDGLRVLDTNELFEEKHIYYYLWYNRAAADYVFCENFRPNTWVQNGLQSNFQGIARHCFVEMQ